MTRLPQLRPYQRQIVQHILQHDRCGVWAGMGMGKTLSTLAAIDALLQVEDGPVLVLAPLRVAQSTWPDEVAKWFPRLRVSPIVGPRARRAAAVRAAADIYTTNYENLPWLVELHGDNWPYRTIVADESTKLKGFRLRQGTMRARALAKVAHRTPRFVELTGTPSPNGLQDIWGQAWFLDRGERLGRTFDSFSQRWFRPHPSGFGVIPLAHAQAEIEERLADLCLSIDPADWFDLREPIVNTIRVPLPAKARLLYEQMEQELFIQLAAGDVEAFDPAGRTIKCLQLASGAIYHDAQQWTDIHDAKLDALESVIEEAAGASVLVAYSFRHELARVLRRFPQARVLDKNPQTIRDWNAGRIPVLVAHPASAGHGLNLQDGGNILVFLSSDWNLEHHLQITERIGPVRQLQAGHNRPVFIHHIVAADTVDELVLKRLATKREVQDLLLEARKEKA